ncbi:glycosyltransferase [Arthrobacter psychrolactophilus]
MAWLLTNAVALVFPSRYEGFGLPIIEAQRLGCPVVSSTAASLPEVGGDASLYFDPDNIFEAIDHIGRLISNTNYRDKVSEAGVINSRRYSWNISARAVVRIAREQAGLI